jgi:hypothetical protein
MPASPAASAELAAMVLDSAPLIASGLAALGNARITFAYSYLGVTVTGPDVGTAFDVIHPAFVAAGWGFSTRYDTTFDHLQEVTFRPPHMLTRCGTPPAFPPR